MVCGKTTAAEDSQAGASHEFTCRHTRCPSPVLRAYLRDSVSVNQNLGPLPLRHFHRLALLGRGRGADLQQHVDNDTEDTTAGDLT